MGRVAEAQSNAGRPCGGFTQLRRLKNLRDALEAAPAGLTLEDLAMALRVTTRSVRRYLLELRRTTEVEAVATEPGGAKRWRIKPSERARAVMLRRAQVYGLLATRQMHDVLRGSALYDEIDEAVRQLLLVAQRPTRPSFRGEVRPSEAMEERFLYVSGPSQQFPQRVEDIDALFQAVSERRLLRFRHRALGGARSLERLTTHPYAMLVFRGALFCVGFDVQTQKERCFRFEHMSDLDVSEEQHFELPENFRVEDYLHGDLGVLVPSDEGAVSVLVEFERSAAEELRGRRVHPSQKTGTSRDGRLRLSMTVPDREAVKRWVLGFGAAARVLEPLDLAAEVVAELNTALDHYGV
ncbi:MAG: WYL domain-containing protein [Myxococcales bacterium]|jgi:predicted DNA-binding transcriptional regulator YafY